MPFHLWPDAGADAHDGSVTLTRRGFLAGAAALAVGASMPALARANAPRPARSAWFALLSDTHIDADPKKANRGQTMADNLRAAIDDVLGQGAPPAGLLIDGDLAHLQGRPADYQTFLHLLEPVRLARVPIHLAMGNHDHRDHVREVVGQVVPASPAGAPADRIVSSFDGGGVRFLMLDSLIETNHTPGRLGQKQLDWLAATLDAAPETPTLVFLHHNPSSSKGALLDTTELLGVLRPRRQVKVFFFGHTHVWDYKSDDGLYLVNLPAVAYPFAAEQPVGWCLFRPETGGATIQMRAHGGNRRSDRVTVELTWRT